ncbi:MAG: Ig-like domain-containing protein [Sandaracinaceae bacterium]|jgi:uncharacterized protein YfaS (alpha-2-macroglobulin family)|nr:Ig-like domain-containing protein [Sandaracinaceae bacterium]
MMRFAILVWGVLACAACGSRHDSRSAQQQHAPAQDLRALFAHLPEPQLSDDGPARLVVREGPAVPAPGHTDAPFPPVSTDDAGLPPGASASDGFRVLGYSPHDRDALTGAVRVTFSEPMVPLEALSAQHVRVAPITISPQPPGRFRWLGTDTVVFEPDARRMPNATTYTVALREGATSALAHHAREAFAFTFKTKPLELVASIPQDHAAAVSTEPTIALRFNQRVDGPTILAALRMRGAAAVQLRLVTAAPELNALKEKYPAIEAWDDGYWIAVRPGAPLARSSNYTLSLARGARSAEGPDLSTQSFDVMFQTYRALAVEECGCPYDDHNICDPRETPHIEFNNPLDLADVDPSSLVRVSPAIDGLRIRPVESGFALEGSLNAATTYTVTIAAAVKDKFNQSLDRDQVRTFRVGDFEAEHSFNVDSIATIERTSPRVLPIDLINTRSVALAATRLSFRNVLSSIVAANRNLAGGTALSSARRVTVATRAQRNQMERVGLDISPEIPENAFGMALIDLPQQQDGWVNHQVRFVQATDLGLTAVTDALGAVARVTSLATGMPLAGVRIAVHSMTPADAPPIVTTLTDANGLARVSYRITTGEVVVEASLGDDHAFVYGGAALISPEVVGAVLSDRDPYRPGDTIHLRMFARRKAGTAQPSLTLIPSSVQIECAVHDAQWAEVSKFNISLNEFGTATHDLVTREGAALGQWSVRCTVQGGHDYQNNNAITGSIHVEEYRAPEIEVHVTAPDGTHFQRDQIDMRASAAYLFGAPAAGLAVSWTLGRERTSFAPPGHADFRFGEDADLFFFGPGTLRSENRWGRSHAVFGVDQSQREVIRTGSGVLGNDGSLRVHALLDPGEPARAAVLGPSKYVLEASVTDTSHQSVAGRLEVIAHPADIYSGTRLEKSFVRESDPIVSRHIVSAIDGQVQSGVRIRVRAYERRSRFTPRQVGGLWVYEYSVEERDVGHCELTSGAAPVECRIGPQHAGQYIIESTVTDSQRRTQTTRVRAWVYGGTFVPSENTHLAEITPDKEEYRAGETAHLLVRVPFAGGRGLLVRERTGIVQAQPLDFTGNVQMVDVPITGADVPNLNIRIALQRGRASDAELQAMLQGLGADARAATRADIGGPQWAINSASLTVNDAPKRLTVTVHPRQTTLSPGARLSVDINVRDSGGHAASSEVSVLVVDESVLSLLAYETPDPVGSLHRPAASVASADSIYAHVVQRTPMRRIGSNGTGFYEAHAEASFGGLGLRGSGRGGGGSGEGTIGLGSLSTIGHGAGVGADSQPVFERGQQNQRAPQTRRARTSATSGAEAPTTTRSLFATTAFYRGNVRTDANGRAHVDIEMPDNLTTFRIMAIAIGRDDRSGSGEAKVRVRKTVVLRPALPRFATYGDTFQAGVVVHNETGAPSDFVIGIRAAGLVVENSGLERIRLAAGESKLVSFPVRVDAAGARARVQFAASAAHGSDAADVELPLVEPATGEAFATYGSLEQGVFRVPVITPNHVIPRFGGLTLSLSSTALTGLDDAAEWLIDYPYLCAEQHASRLVAASALRTILGDGRVPDGEQKARELARVSIVELQRLQRSSGGFAYWAEEHRQHLYVSAWVTYALLEAKRAGFDVPQTMLDHALAFVTHRLERPNVQLGEDQAWAEQALALYVLAEAERVLNPELLNRVHAHVRELPVFAKAWLDRALRRANANDPRATALWTEISNGAVLTAAGAHFAEERVESARLLWHSERRTDAIVLANLLNRAPQDPLVERTARSLAAARVSGHWETTNETAWALSALVRYYRIAEAVVPNTNVSAWIGNDFVGTTPFHGRSSRVLDAQIPMVDLLARGARTSDFVIAPSGEGRVYYRLGLRYAPTDLRMPAESQGFTVSRTYEPIDSPGSVRRDNDGTWHIQNEANVRVRVTLIVPDDRYDVAVDDPLPAGLEATNMTFATSSTQSLSGELDETRIDFGNYFAMFAFDHREMRDDRTVAFSRVAPAGVYELTYLARATTPGRFIATATHVEEMYAPETFARGVTETVVVEP